MWKAIKRLFGKRKRQRRYVMILGDMDTGTLCEFLKKHTPVITQREYNALPERLKTLFIKVGAK